MRNHTPILFPAVMGTSVMTSFSHLLSDLYKEDFSEPRHLSVMLKRLAPGISKKWAFIAGWGAHYAVGVLFASVYAELWRSGKLRPTLATGAILGALSGAIAVMVWKATFKAHPTPPWIDYSKYYIQLVPAHVVFAVITTITYRLQQLKQEADMLPDGDA